MQRIFNQKQNNLVVGIVGLKGSGKTLILTLLLYIEFLNGRKVYTNYEVFFPHELLDINKLIKLDESLKDSAIGISEMHMICDARKHTRTQNIQMSYFILQSRHRSVNVYYDTQMERQIDIRIVENTDIKIVCDNLYVDSDNDGLNDIFYFVIQDKRLNPIRFTERIIYGKPIFSLYNSDYIVDPFTMKELKKMRR